MREWTEKQLDAINSRGCNLIVSAGAGSGKTAVMIERICSLIREGQDVRRMLVCTFTKTAATDMKRKLAAALSESDDPALRARLAELSASDICTLHSWCSRLIKTWFYDIGIDPDYTLLEEGEALLLKTQAAEAAISEFLENGNDDFARLYEAFRTNRNHSKLLDSALAVYDYSVAQPCPEEWLNRGAQKTDSEYRAALNARCDKELEVFFGRAQNLKSRQLAAGFTLDTAALEELCECARAWQKCDSATPQLRKDKQFADLHDEFKSLKKKYADLRARRLKIAEMPDFTESERYCKALSSLVLRMSEIYAEYKRERVKADYSDLEHEALRILGGSHGAEITAAYDYVFVDVYQDIRPLQEKILSAFSCEMFFVGDVKQSIYGFRMCRPDFFINKRKSCDGIKNKAIDLNANFRSGGNILSAVNEVFAKTMTDGFGGADYMSASMTAGLDLPSSVSAVFTDYAGEEFAPEPKIYSVKSDAAAVSDPSLESRVDAVVNEIIDMLCGKIGEGENARDAEFGDIAVLVRSRGKFTELLERKLRAVSVPVASVSGEERADAFPTVAALISYLRIIDNSRDDVNLAAAMLSPAFGNFSADELALIRAGAEGDFCDCVFARAAEGTDEKLKDFTDKLDGFRKLNAESTVWELAGAVTAEYKCFNHALAAGGEREAAALDAFLEHLAKQERDVLHEYLRYADSCGSPKIKVPEGGKAVRIMTVHASKGLEFECVLLPELDKRFNRSDVYASVICDEEEGVVLRSFDFENRSVCENPRFAVCSARLKRALAAEELRILYVAMTRAKYKLTLFAQRPETRGEESEAEFADSYLDWLYSFMRSAEKEPPAARETPRREQRREPNGKIIEELSHRIEQNEKKRERLMLESAPVKTSVSGMARAYEDDGEPPAPVRFADDRAAKRGSAFHKFMQWADFRKAGEWERLCAAFPEEAALVSDGEEDIKAAFSAVAEFIGGRRFAREKAFVYTRSPLGRDTLVQGVIDLMVFNPDGSADIVDYKTGAEKNLRDKAYQKQLALYKEAAQSVLGIKVRKTYLYGFSCRKFIEINPS